MRKYDAALKLVLQRWGAVTLHQLTDEAIVGWRSIEFPKVSTQYADLLAETASGRLWHLELQSGNDPEMALRMLEYSTRVYRVSGRFPRQCVLYVGREPLRMDSELAGEDLSFHYRLVDIRELDGERLLASGHAGDNILAILTGLRGSQETVQRILKALAGLERPERELALEVLFLLAGLRELEETVEQEARKMPVFNDILENKVLGREVKRGRAEGIAEGIAEGMKEGIKEGIKEGVQRGELTLLRRQMVKRCGEIPPAVDERLSKLSPEELEPLSDRILDARSLDELLP